jgi:hypothetical protein
MRPLVGELLLDAWERGLAETALNRPLALLAAARGKPACEEFAGLSLMDRDLELLRLRRLTFGDTLRGVFACGGCATPLEFEMPVTPMIDRLEQLPSFREAAWQAGELEFSMRPVTTRDLVAIATARDPRRSLLELCTSVKGRGAETAIEAQEHSAAQQFNQLNEHAEARIAVTCPACGTTDEAELDIGRFLWADVRHAALRMMRDVHELASAYGWPEWEILAMPAARRACYLEMTRA